MSPIVQAYLAGIGTAVFAVLAVLATLEIVSLRTPRELRGAEVPTARQMRREMRARAIKRIA